MMQRVLVCVLLVALVHSVRARYHVDNYQLGPEGLSGTLVLQNDDGDGDEFEHALPTLHFEFRYETNAQLRLRITDANSDRWEIPEIAADPVDWPREHADDPLYAVSFVASPFQFTVTRLFGAEGTQQLFDTTGSKAPVLVMTPDFVQIGTKLPYDPFIYGIGERRGPLNRAVNDTCQLYTVWSKDQSAGTPVGENLYGAHPFYLDVRPREVASHGVLFANSNAMDVEVCAEPADKSLTFRSTGGIVDLVFFLGGTTDGRGEVVPDVSFPEAIVAQYHRYLGHTAMPPLWALGFHQSRWGMGDVAAMQQVVDGYAAAGLPLQVMWSDIDYMDHSGVWTLNADYATLPDFVNALHAEGKQYVMIADPGVKIPAGGTAYTPYDDGIAAGIFVRDSTGVPYVGKTRFGAVHFPDFTHDDAAAYWTDQISTFRTRVGFDGLWIDVNELSNDCGRCVLDVNNAAHWATPGCPATCTEHAQIVPTRPVGDAPLWENTLATTAQHALGREYDVHNLYALYEARHTRAALRATGGGTRPFVLSRSTTVGSGVHTAHWLGDNESTWHDLAGGIVGVMSMGLYGIPMVGDDACGFGGDTTPELCARWMQVSAFYTFTRSHNHRDAAPQELYRFDDEMRAVMGEALRVKYEIVPYVYSLLYRAHRWGGTVVRPLFFDTPTDVEALGVEHQFMVGPALMVLPVLEEGADAVTGYFPGPDGWFYYFSGQEHTKVHGEITHGHFTSYTAVDVMHVFVRGGHIVPIHKAAEDERAHVSAAMLTHLDLLIALDRNGGAAGELYVDDGTSETPASSALFSFSVTVDDDACYHVGVARDGTYAEGAVTLRTVRVLGVPRTGDDDATVWPVRAGASHSVPLVYTRVDALEYTIDMDVGIDLQAASADGGEAETVVRWCMELPKPSHQHAGLVAGVTIASVVLLVGIVLGLRHVRESERLREAAAWGDEEDEDLEEGRLMDGESDSDDDDGGGVEMRDGEFDAAYDDGEDDAMPEFQFVLPKEKKKKKKKKKGKGKGKGKWKPPPPPRE